MKRLLEPIIALSAAGLVASLVVHFCSLLGRPNPFGEYAWTLHIGIFVVWLPTVIVTNKVMRNSHVKQKDIWKVALMGCPSWMRYMTYGFFGYAFLNFGIFFLRTIGKDPKSIGPIVELQGFSGHWMAFYSAALSSLYSASRQVESKCANGHVTSPAAKFCEECGSPVMTTIDGAS